MGHTALKCYHRFNHSYQAEVERVAAATTTLTYNINTNWYADLGAMDHLTNDHNKLIVKEKYHGKDHVQAANGSDMHIFLVGHYKLSTPTHSRTLKNILHVPRINRNFLSIQKFAHVTTRFLNSILTCF